MYKTIVASRLRKAYANISAGEFEKVFANFHDDMCFQMIGEHHLGGERRGIAEVRAWFEEVGQLFPDLRLEPETVIVSGWPWNTKVATRFRVSSSLADGGRYENVGMQFLRLRWGKAVEDRLYEDTVVLTDAIERQRAGAGAAG